MDKNPNEGTSIQAGEDEGRKAQQEGKDEMGHEAVDLPPSASQESIVSPRQQGFTEGHGQIGREGEVIEKHAIGRGGRGTRPTGREAEEAKQGLQKQDGSAPLGLHVDERHASSSPEVTAPIPSPAGETASPTTRTASRDSTVSNRPWNTADRQHRASTSSGLSSSSELTSESTGLGNSLVEMC